MLSLIRRSFKQARGERISSLAIFVLCVISATLTAAPRGQYQQNDQVIAIREIRDSLEDIRHEVSNHEIEIRVFDEKLKNFDSIIETVRDQMSDSTKQHKEQLRGNSASLDSKITALEATSNGLVNDLRQFKIHSNETIASLTQYKQKIGELEKIIDQQNQNIEHLQAAMRSLMEALQGKPQISSKTTAESGAGVNISRLSSNSDRSYKVKSGDSLEKIARAHQTSIQAIKEINGLTTDRIVVGKTLIIPEK